MSKRPLLSILPLLGACTAVPPVLGPPTPVTPLAPLAVPAWIAHRGNSSAAPENTLAAIRSALALEQPPDYVEIDVHTTADGILAVIHDSTLERTTDRSGEVAKLPWAAVRSADAGFAERFGDRFAGEVVPRLEEVLDAVANRPTGVMIEVKAHGAGEPAARRVVARGEAGEHVLASFYADVIVDASMAAPDLRTLLLAGDAGPEHVELARRTGASILGVDHESASAELVRRAHTAGLLVWAWTVDDPKRAQELLARGVDGIISNRVDVVRPDDLQEPAGEAARLDG